MSIDPELYLGGRLFLFSSTQPGNAMSLFFTTTMYIILIFILLILMNITISGDYIELNKLIKHLGWVDSGGEAKLAISGGLVFVNGEEELRIRRKCISGDKITFEGESVVIKK